ncbi:hypothetical protein BDK51DRAFT_32819 [Blyttiomyces helicus]|uniref:Protein kinase domain-containing protein n=1 Tax=Blyttiomyces helicus TaxID=388810 RepID=A0A4P9WLH0_9FUNG|nr:hypothetical protein BDK51DRAFT_32819 [Blyttiomyces helicus]|eukprot:RKO93881.1 hypothetical protein BDK51DRAFT_32819 [Blyttiomyces helicus]
MSTFSKPSLNFKNCRASHLGSSKARKRGYSNRLGNRRLGASVRENLTKRPQDKAHTATSNAQRYNTDLVKKFDDASKKWQFQAEDLKGTRASWSGMRVLIVRFLAQHPTDHLGKKNSANLFIDKTAFGMEQKKLTGFFGLTLTIAMVMFGFLVNYGIQPPPGVTIQVDGHLLHTLPTSVLRALIATNDGTAADTKPNAPRPWLLQRAFEVLAAGESNAASSDFDEETGLFAWSSVLSPGADPLLVVPPTASAEHPSGDPAPIISHPPSPLALPLHLNPPVDASTFFYVACPELIYGDEFMDMTSSSQKDVGVKPDSIALWDSFEAGAREWTPPFPSFELELVQKSDRVQEWRVAKSGGGAGSPARIYLESDLDAALLQGYHQVLRAVFGEMASTFSLEPPPTMVLGNRKSCTSVKTQPDHVLSHIMMNPNSHKLRQTPIFLFETKREGILKKLPIGDDIRACYALGASGVSVRSYFVRRDEGKDWSVSRAILATATTTSTTVSWRRALAYAWSLAVAERTGLEGIALPPPPPGPYPPPGDDDEPASPRSPPPSPFGPSSLPPPSDRTHGRLRPRATTTQAIKEGQSMSEGRLDEGKEEGPDSAYANFPTVLRRLAEADIDHFRDEWIGDGATARVFRGAIRGIPAAIKYVDLAKVENAESIVHAEIEAYTALRDLQGTAIPRFIDGGRLPMVGVVAVEEIRPGRVVGAMGWSDLSPTDQDLAREALRKLHAKGYVHGDVRLPNLMFAQGDGGGRRAVWIDIAGARRATAEEMREEEEELEGM